MKKLLTHFAAISAVSFSASATMLTSNISMDNGFQVYLSTSDSVTGTQFGAHESWPTTFVDTTTLTVGTDYYLHVFGYDQGGIAGFLGKFTLDTSDHVFSNGNDSLLTNTTDWQGNATGFNGSYSSLSDLGVNGVSPWGLRPGIDSSAKWIWSGDANNNNASYFTTKISAVSVPDVGSTSALFALSLLGVLTVRYKVKG